VASHHKEALGIANGKVVSKYSDHLPLCRQAQIYARQGIDLFRDDMTPEEREAVYRQMLKMPARR
jgi:transposase